MAGISLKKLVLRFGIDYRKDGELIIYATYNNDIPTV